MVVVVPITANVTYAYLHLPGLPEHASSFQLKTTSGEGASYSDPYRLYNLDVFEYELDEPMALYGSIPLIVSHNKNITAGLFYFNPTETFVDVKNTVRGWHRRPLLLLLLLLLLLNDMLFSPSGLLP